MIVYRYLVRHAGYRGRAVAHLADERGEAVCGLALGERWDLATATQRRVCSRCLAQSIGNVHDINRLQLYPNRTD